MSRIGWLRLYRQTMESDFWLIDHPFSYRDAFIHVLLSANWVKGVTTKNGHTLEVQRGQMLTSIRKLGATFHWDKHKVYQWLKFMAAADMLKSENVGFGTVLTIVNYDKYQNDADTPTHAPAHEVAHEDTHGDTHEPTHAPAHEVAPRYKNKEIRTQKEESQSPAAAGPPPAVKREPPIGSKEWYALHYDD